MTPEIVVLPDRTALAREAAARFVSITQTAIRARGKCSVALSGGSTPRDLYALLATQEFSSQVDWRYVHLFWGDERAVPPDHRGDLGHPDSNFKMAKDVLISRVPIPAENVHRIRAELAPDAAAREYEHEIWKLFARDTIPPTPLDKGGSRGDRVPVFDLILLGLGPDAHTASLFPHTPVLDETARWVAAQYVQKLNTYRITFTPPLINAAENILFLVAGADKADAVYAVLRGEHRVKDFPAQVVRPRQGKLVWLLDDAASAKLAA